MVGLPVLAGVAVGAWITQRAKEVGERSLGSKKPTGDAFADAMKAQIAKLVALAEEANKSK
jgi:hypothetical protein